jgi:hypothetical protein
MIGKKKPQTKRLVRWLNHYRYGREITGMIQSLMIGTIFLEQFNVPRQLYFFIIPATAFGFIVIGYLLKRWKIFEKDLEYRSSQNPVMSEMLEILKRIDNGNNKHSKRHERQN